jgi:hypothetical protein
MPKISVFYGIVIYMYFYDHFPSHFHAQYGEFSAKINIGNFALLEGYLPPKALALVVEWAMLHQKELTENWEKMLKKEPFQAIPPLE